MYVCAHLEVCLNGHTIVLSQLALKLNFFAPFKIELTINNHLSSKPPNYVVLGNSKSRSAFYLFINIRYYFLISFPYSFFFFFLPLFPNPLLMVQTRWLMGTSCTRRIGNNLGRPSPSFFIIINGFRLISMIKLHKLRA